MADITLDQALPVVRNLAQRKAHAFVRRCGLAVHESEDVESQLVLIFIARWPKFDRERASVRTFASRLMDSELTSILRYRLAQSRQLREFPVLCGGPTLVSIQQFRVDLERAMAPLPEVVRKTGSALSCFSAVEAAAVMMCSRQTVSMRKYRIRDALLAAGIQPNYFVGRGSPS